MKILFTMEFILPINIYRALINDDFGPLNDSETEFVKKFNTSAEDIADSLGVGVDWELTDDIWTHYAESNDYNNIPQDCFEVTLDFTKKG